jgi:hypothetical protein
MKLEDQIAGGMPTVEGDTENLKQLASARVVFDPRFEILAGTLGLALSHV